MITNTHLTFALVFLLFSSAVRAGPSAPKAAPIQPITTLPGTTARDYITFPSIDMPGNDIVYVSIPFISCASYCDSTPGCIVYTEELNQHFNCWMKSAQSFRDNGDRASMVLKQPARAYTQQVLVDYAGNDIVGFKGSLSDCAAACDAVTTCIGYTVVPNNPNTCNLKSKMEPNNLSMKTDYSSFILNTSTKPIPTYLSFPQTNLDSQTNLFYADVNFDYCPFICANTKYCRGWTQNTNNNRGCWIKDSTASAHSDGALNSFVLATQKVRNYGILAHSSFGVGRLTTYQGSKDQCSVACDSLDGCNAYAIDNQKTGNCVLQSTLEGYQYSANMDTFALSG